MHRRKDCEKYRLWKKKRAIESGEKIRKIKKDKRKGRTIDCTDEENDEVSETRELKVSYRECHEKGKQKTWQLERQRFKRLVSLTDVLLKRIQPSIELREQLLNQRHAVCLQDKPPETDRLNSKEFIETRPKSRQKATKKKTTRTIDKDEATSDEINTKQTVDGNDVGDVKDDGETKDVKNDTSDGEKIKRKRKRMRKKSRRERIEAKRKSDEDTESCSICSFDSEICLAGVILTAEDKKKIQKLRRQE